MASNNARWWRAVLVDHIAAVAALTGVLGLLIAAIPVYWSYLCRSQGEYCEGSVSAPGAVNDNKDKFLSRVSSPEGLAGFERLLIKERGSWLFGFRADVVAQFKDGSQLTVDSFPSVGGIEILNDLEDQVAVIISKGPPDGGLARITTFFPNQQLIKRVFDIACATPFSSDGQYANISNLTYSGTDRSFIFDLQTSCAWISINHNIETRVSKFTSDKPPYGTNLVLQLNSNLQAASLLSARSRELFLKSENYFKSCEKDMRESPSKSEGELFACYKHRADPNLELSELVVFQWKDEKFKELDSSSCSDGVYWTKDPSGKQIFSSCTMLKTDTKTTLGLSVFSEPFNVEKYYHFEGECTAINVWQMKLGANDHSILLELATDCQEIVIDDKPIKIRSGAGKTRAIYELVLDRHWLVESFSPLSTTSSITK